MTILRLRDKSSRDKVVGATLTLTYSRACAKIWIIKYRCESSGGWGEDEGEQQKEEERPPRGSSARLIFSHPFSLSRERVFFLFVFVFFIILFSFPGSESHLRLTLITPRNEAGAASWYESTPRYPDLSDSCWPAAVSR